EEIWAKGSLKVETKTVNYFTGTQGFLAKPADKGTYPGIIMIHEWWGLNDNIK
ncbi:MAG: dienelactone hydrolase family protein, partial [Candidatus Diapherotrites archaeon]|nr:dienelactone hydrolase family protein [Candidatus Diapherotrites archaeon]